MKILIILLTVLSLNASQCNKAEIDYDKSNKLYRAGEKDHCYNMARNLDIIIQRCDYSERTKRIVGFMRDEQIKICETEGR